MAEDHQPNEGAVPAETQSDNFVDLGHQVEEIALSSESIEETATGDGKEPKMVEEIESLCMNCHKEGTTRLLLTKIPFFREIVIMSFECPHCNLKNSEIQPAGEIQPLGAKYLLDAYREDLGRQVVKSDTCTVSFPDLALEIPAGRGQLTNVEGILTMVAQDLAALQEKRKEETPEVYEKLEGVIESLNAMASGAQSPFIIAVDDPAGNSWIEPSPEDKHGKYTKFQYKRSSEQNAALGLGDTSTAAPEPEIRPEYRAEGMVPAMPAATAALDQDAEDDNIVEGKVYDFPTECPGCMRMCVTHMKMVNIPHFSEVVIMSTVCDACGYRTNEVKSGGGVPGKGRRITLKVNGIEDLKRDILKAENCALTCPELGLNVQPGTLGGRFTTIEGLLTQVRDDLRRQIFDAEGEGYEGGDSLAAEEKAKWDKFFGDMSKALEGELEFTCILEDPLAASYVQSYTAPDPDQQMTVEDYERTDEEEEHLGLKDIQTEDYGEGEGSGEGEDKPEGSNG
ncbi:MAG: nucleolar zinc-finger protein [Bathelium mastoideum]|nr:MAG: nucleolar zinc-finger protein [Bathelium mastoideum]KAI9686172.1 MAG: nucleolar zinc-finger protein [Bathelium mastoideum]